MEPVLSDTPREHETGSDCKGYRNTQAFILVNRNTGNNLLWMLENSGVGLHKFHCTISGHIIKCICYRTIVLYIFNIKTKFYTIVYSQRDNI